MKAIIVAAGRGSRMGHATEELPKCMLKIRGRTLISLSLDGLRTNGVYDIVVVRGYLGDRIDCINVIYVENKDWKANNILYSVFCAKEFLSGDVIILYSDIIFSPALVERLISSAGDIVPVVDVDWREAYIGRTLHPPSEAEKVKLSATGTIEQIGKRLPREKDANGEFIGMLKLNDRGCGVLKERFDLAERRGQLASFHSARTFQTALLSDLLQDLVDNGVEIWPLLCRSGWREIDTEQDLASAENWFIQNS